MTKKQLLEKLTLADDIESAAAASRIYECLLDIISDELIAGNSVALGQRFGEFKVNTQAAKSGSMNGVAYSTPAKQVVKFRTSAPFKAAVAGN